MFQPISPTTQFTARIDIASRQSNVVFVRLTEDMPEHTLEFKIKKQWDMPDRQNLEKIIVYNNGKLHIFNRK
jgi:hypothetical protein